MAVVVFVTVAAAGRHLRRRRCHQCAQRLRCCPAAPPPSLSSASSSWPCLSRSLLLLLLLAVTSAAAHNASLLPCCPTSAVVISVIVAAVVETLCVQHAAVAGTAAAAEGDAEITAGGGDGWCSLRVGLASGQVGAAWEGVSCATWSSIVRRNRFTAYSNTLERGSMHGELQKIRCDVEGRLGNAVVARPCLRDAIALQACTQRKPRRCASAFVRRRCGLLSQLQ